MLANETEEGRDAWGIGRRASERQELAELATATTGEMQDCHQPDLQTSKHGWEGNTHAQHTSPAGASPGGDAEKIPTESSETLKEWGPHGGLGPRRGAWKSQGALRPSEDPSIQAERTRAVLSFSLQ